ncbi:MAG TPA: acetylglutamate kinase [Campylobacteraceae bacterium]|jgi:acetylglutamate kinase|nr:acetylglutamate kinase [Campylobacteraceae bacterium]HHD83832.1 acetylglutamate kinase [Campylobacteraceae bacterium]
MKQKIEQVSVLLDALPYIKKYNDQIFVIKYGGSAQITPELKEKFARDIVLMYLVGIKPVIIHGGGKAIGEMLTRLDLGSHFIDGLRVTDEKVMEVVEMVLCGNINKDITALLNEHGTKAIGISGKDASMIKAKPLDFDKYGYVGEITKVDPGVICNLIAEKFIPVIAPVATGKHSGHPGFNINADIAAGYIAASLKARKIIFMTDTPGVMDRDKTFIHTLDEEKIARLKNQGVIAGGMIPKVDACLKAVKGGVKKAHIIDGRIEHALLLEIFTSEGVGTVIK